MGLACLNGEFDPRRSFFLATAISAAALVSSEALARSMTQSVHCVSAAASAAPICEKIGELVESAGWLGKHPGVSIGVEILNNSATQLHVVLHIAAPNGQTHKIDRAFSVTDTSMTTEMQDRFLRRLITALPSTL
jgi:hypothetical protein